MEHRWGNRIEMDLPVRLAGAGIIGNGRIRNLSTTGAFIETQLPLAELTLVRVQLQGGAQGRVAPSGAWAFVVRQTSSGAGLEWCEPIATQSAAEPSTRCNSRRTGETGIRRSKQVLSSVMPAHDANHNAASMKAR